MVNKILCVLILAFLSLNLFSQSNQEDVVYLKTGSVLRGKIIENKAGDKLKIELMGGSVFVFQQNEIDSIKKENALKNKLKELKKNYFRRNHGYRNFTELGLIYGTNLKTYDNDPYSTSGKDDFGISMHTVNGYQFWPYLFVGAGLGIDRFITYQQTFSPIYLRLSSEFLKKKVTPYVFMDAGYSVMWQRKADSYASYNNKGGLYASAGGGVRIYTRSRASVLLSVAWMRIDSETDWRYTYDTGSLYTVKRMYQRLVTNIGVTF